MTLLRVTVVVLLFCLVKNEEGNVGLPGIWQGCGGRGIGTVPVRAAVGRCSSGLTWVSFGDGMSTGIPVTQRTMRSGSGCW